MNYKNKKIMSNRGTKLLIAFRKKLKTLGLSVKEIHKKKVENKVF